MLALHISGRSVHIIGVDCVRTPRSEPNVLRPAASRSANALCPALMHTRYVAGTVPTECQFKYALSTNGEAGGGLGWVTERVEPIKGGHHPGAERSIRVIFIDAGTNNRRSFIGLESFRPRCSICGT